MTKLTVYLSILIFVDLMFIITGQLSEISPTSIILDAILNPESILSLKFFLVFFGLAGVGALATTAGVTTGIINKAGISILGFAAMSTVLTGLMGDFVTIWIILFQANPVLASLLFAPIVVLFPITLVEWLRVQS